MLHDHAAQEVAKMLRKALLGCGAVASVLYVGIDVLAALRYPEYHSFTSRVVSELMASGAPTEGLVDPLFLLYDVLMMAFAIGVWMSGHERSLHVTGALLFAYAALGLTGPTLFEMNLRGSAEGSTADVLHMAVTGVILILIFATLAFGASTQRRRFRLYSLATALVMVVFGVLTSFAIRGIATGEPTPWCGLTERINIGAFLLWVAAFAAVLFAPTQGQRAMPSVS